MFTTRARTALGVGLAACGLTIGIGGATIAASEVSDHVIDYLDHSSAQTALLQQWMQRSMPAGGYTFTMLGDDNGDGVMMEDESGWDCRTMGNMVCAPVPATEVK